MGVDSEEIVKKFLSSYGLESERFKKHELGETKTPDFRCFNGDDPFCYCEVKNAEKDMWLDKKL